jgi:hypothetical protein
MAGWDLTALFPERRLALSQSEYERQSAPAISGRASLLADSWLFGGCYSVTASIPANA